MKLVRDKISVVVCLKEITLQNVKAAAAGLAAHNWDMPIISLAELNHTPEDINLVGSAYGTQIYRPHSSDTILIYAVDALREDLDVHLKSLICVESTQKAVIILFTANSNSADILRRSTSALFSHLPTYRKSYPQIQIDRHYDAWFENKKYLSRFRGISFEPSFIADVVLSRGVITSALDSFDTPVGQLKLNLSHCSWKDDKLCLNAGQSPAVYGPYTTLDAGCYEVTFAAKLDKELVASEIVLDIAAHNGEASIAASKFIFNYADAGSHQSLTVLFELERPVDDLETRLWVRSGDPIIVNRYILRKVE